MTAPSSIDFAALIRPVALDLLGAPNKALSSKRELRFGTHGSLSVNLRKGQWFDHETQTGGGLLDLIARETGRKRLDAIAWLRERGYSTPEAPRTHHEKDASVEKFDARIRTLHALRIWHEARAVRGSPAWPYLARRGVDLAGIPDHVVDDALRWHPSCPCEGERHGCMVALWTDAISGEPRAIHRTALSPSGEKIGRLSLGPCSECVIRLWPDETIYQSLAIAEGIETALVAATRVRRQPSNHLIRPIWAAGDAGHIRRLPVLAKVHGLTILVDRDIAGREAAAACAARWRAAGRSVELLEPLIDKSGADFADLGASL